MFQNTYLSSTTVALAHMILLFSNNFKLYFKNNSFLFLTEFLRIDFGLTSLNISSLNINICKLGMCYTLSYFGNLEARLKKVCLLLRHKTRMTLLLSLSASLSFPPLPPKAVLVPRDTSHNCLSRTLFKYIPRCSLRELHSIYCIL